MGVARSGDTQCLAQRLETTLLVRSGYSHSAIALLETPIAPVSGIDAAILVAKGSGAVRLIVAEFPFEPTSRELTDGVTL